VTWRTSREESEFKDQQIENLKLGLAERSEREVKK
jgi:hypothetical protein